MVMAAKEAHFSGTLKNNPSMEKTNVCSKSAGYCLLEESWLMLIGACTREVNSCYACLPAITRRDEQSNKHRNLHKHTPMVAGNPGLPHPGGAVSRQSTQQTTVPCVHAPRE